MSDSKAPDLPIGYWIKQADRILTSEIDRAQAENGLSRTEWQILHMLHQVTAASRSRIVETLSPFADEASIRTTLARLANRGLTRASAAADPEYRLTDEGRHLHEKALATQNEIRQQAVSGIGEAEYVTAVDVLRKIVANLNGS